MINFLLNLSLMLCVVFSASKDYRSAEFLSYQIDLDNTILAELPPNSYNEWIYLTNDRIKVKYSSNFEIPGADLRPILDFLKMKFIML